MLGLRYGALALCSIAPLVLAACDVEDSGDGGRPDGFVQTDAGTDATPGVDAGERDAAGPSCGEPTAGNECTSDAICDDHCFCNGIERCRGGVCQAGEPPCVDAIDCTMDRCDDDSDSCIHEPDDEMCQDDDLCNGTERCSLVVTDDVDERGCGPGSELYCNDEDSCTVDSCEPSTGCVFTAKDLDGDGFGDFRCGGEDCDDDPRTGRDIHPGAIEICDNRRDDDCDSRRDYLDTDCLPTNDDCSSVQHLPDAGVYSGSTRGLAGHTTLGCSTIAGGDAYFSFTLTEPHDVSITAAGGSGGFGETLAVGLRSTCGSGPEVRCSAGPSLATVRQRSLAAGTYFIIVKTATATEFDLTVRITDPTVAPAVDTCDAMTQDVSRGGTFTGTFDEVEDDYRLDCNFATGIRDAVYRLTLTSAKDVTLRASTSGDFTQTFLSLTTDCGNPSSRLICEAGDFLGSAEIRRRGLPAGTYYVLVESSDSTSTGWTLDVTVTDPAPRLPADACETAVDITDSLQSVAIGSFENDVGTSCGGTGDTFRDAIFTFDLPSPRDVILSVDHSASAFVYVAVRSGGCTAPELRCRSGTVPQNALFRALPAGRYYVIVSTGTLSGNISASATTAPPSMVPADDQCAGAAVIDVASSGGLVAAAVTGTTVGYEDNGMTRCGGSNRLDRYYQFTLTARRSIQLLLTPDSSSAQMYLELETTCGAPATDATRCRGSVGGSFPSVAAVLDPGTYFVAVESTEATAGGYSLTVLSNMAP